jgi:hypothetical protein
MYVRKVSYQRLDLRHRSGLVRSVQSHFKLRGVETVFREVGA